MSGWQKYPDTGAQNSFGTALIPYVESSPPPPVKERRIRLGSIGEIRKEMARVYRDCANGKLDGTQAGRLTYMLREIAVLIRDHQIEARVEALEAERDQ